MQKLFILFNLRANLDRQISIHENQKKMKKLLILLVCVPTITLINTRTAFSPIITEFVITMPEVIYTMPKPVHVLQAMIYVETGTKGKTAYNPNEPQAVGILQIWPITVDDVNRIVGYKRYKYKDRLNDEKAIEMFWIYQGHYNPNFNVEKMCRIWCGGPDGDTQKSTLAYYKLVKQRLEQMRYPIV